jgi:hypothetical protein
MIFTLTGKYIMQIAVRAGGLSAIVVSGIAILYATFYVWLGVDSPGSMKVTCLSKLYI